MSISIGQNIKKLRVERGMTQKELGIAVGFKPSTADVRIAQYESSTRSPKEIILNSIASVLDVEPSALAASDMELHSHLLLRLNELENLCNRCIIEIHNIHNDLQTRKGGAPDGDQISTNHRLI